MGISRFNMPTASTSGSCNSSGNFFIVSHSSSCPVLSAGIAHTGLTLPAGASEWNQAVCGSVRQFRAVDASEFRRQFLTVSNSLFFIPVLSSIPSARR